MVRECTSGMLKSKFRIIQRLRRIHIENKGLKVLALLLAFILYFVSRQPISDVRLTGIPIEFRGLNQGMEVMVDTQQTVNVRLRGPRDIVRGLTPNQIAVIADLSDKEPGERNIQFRPDDVSRPNDIEVLQIDPASITFRIDKKIRRLVEVRPNFSDQLPEGFEVYSSSITPSQVEVEGPQSQVKSITSLKTETINLSDKKSDFKSYVDVEALQHAIRVKTPGPISVRIEIGEIRTRRTLRGVPVHWEDAQPGYRLLTQTLNVELYGPTSSLETIEQKQITAVIRTGKLTEKTASVKPEISLPDNVDKHVRIESHAPSEIKLKKH